MTAAHTPGPWAIYDYDTQLHVEAPGRSSICDIQNRYHTNERNANARLIAAAPDLLAALEQIVEEMRPSRPDWHLDISSEGQRMARAALAKAREEQP